MILRFLFLLAFESFIHCAFEARSWNCTILCLRYIGSRRKTADIELKSRYPYAAFLNCNFIANGCTVTTSLQKIKKKNSSLQLLKVLNINKISIFVSRKFFFNFIFILHVPYYIAFPQRMYLVAMTWIVKQQGFSFISSVLFTILV